MTLSAGAGSIVAGASSQVTANIARTGGFTGDVAIASTGAPAGVTVTAGTIAANSTSQVITISTAANAAPGISNLSITATGTGVTITPAAFALTVTAAPVPAATLTLSSAVATAIAGESTTVTATIARSGGFAAAVTIDATGAPAGVTVTAGTIDAAGTTQTISIATTTAAPAGVHNLSITAVGTGVTIAPAALALTITAPPTGQIGNDLLGEADDDQFGYSVALSADGTRVIVGANFNDGTGTNAGHARVFERSGDAWVQLGADLDGEAAEDRYGSSVAISDDGSRVAVGSYLNDGGGISSGNVRVFDLVGGAWVQVGTDIDGPLHRGAGWALAMSASGHRVVAGGPTSGDDAGAVIVHELISNVWVQVGDQFFQTSGELGHAVTMSDDGNRIAFSLPSAGGSSLPGTTRVFDWNGTTWVAVGSPINGENISDFAGNSLSLSGAGDVLAIGAPRNVGEGLAGGGGTGGHVRVYRLESGVWTQLGADLDGPPGSMLGSSVSISGDGTRLVAGAPSHSLVIFYTLSGGTWTPSATPDFGSGGRNGSAVAISADGTVAASGSIYHDSARGLVRVYSLP
jgi:WD40 repeat protein